MSGFTLTRRIAARPSIVFDALATAEGIATWWGPDALPVTLAEADPRVGGAFRVRFHTEDGLEHEASGDYLEVVPPRRLVMSWRWTLNGEPDEAGRTSRIEIELEPVAGGVELTFTHSGLAGAVSERSHREGWSGSLDKLVQRLG